MRGMTGMLLMGVPLGSSGGGFSPDSLEGLGLWIDAAHAASLFQDSAGTTPASANGDPLGRVGRLPANYAWMDVTANKPSLILNQLNGRPVIRFGNNDWFWLTNLSLLKNVASYTYFAVLKYSNTTGIRTELFYSVGTGAVSSRFSSNMADATHLLGISGRRLDTDSLGLMRNADADFNFMIKEAVVSHATATASVTKNGTVVVSGAYLTTGSTSNTDSQRATVGAATDPIGQFFGGDLAEMLLYVPALTDEQRLSVRQYLSDKWGIALS